MFDEQVQSSRDRQREQTRARIIDTAQRLFTEHGFQATTIRRIAETAGVSVGSVMAVGDKDSLLLIAFDRWIGDVHEKRAAAGLEPADDPVRGIGDVVQPFLELFSSNAALAREYGAILARGTHDTAVFGDLAVALTGEFEQVVRAAGLGDRAPAVARVLYYSYLGLLRSASVGGLDPMIVRAGLEDVAETVLRGT
ncbi:TetR/AcrR family transcriptional regulator [Tsukamurella sp. 8F]|uniref:TetR/AcrR family transcriptional regulator n=1 Tax=unclassified Tsukamurella TaxID=2633480 RepID=UPI0023B99F39|nr:MULTISPECIES: TetR/AcrR family transcriptional regulator [unclassified Tsukamurella]MDF0528453.1 TetR/AcrR family transcriptional regulator [Tsukamurella sp. 8J]MDF0586279.1 TetR/AcrR family transcriptional regulator [Tsukamurella sp. 8F]